MHWEGWNCWAWYGTFMLYPLYVLKLVGQFYTGWGSEKLSWAQLLCYLKLVLWDEWAASVLVSSVAPRGVQQQQSVSVLTWLLQSSAFYLEFFPLILEGSVLHLWTLAMGVGSQSYKTAGEIHVGVPFSAETGSAGCWVGGEEALPSQHGGCWLLPLPRPCTQAEIRGLLFLRAAV